MNKIQINAVVDTIMTALYESFNKKNQATQEIVDPRVTKIIAEAAKLRKSAAELNVALEKKHPNHAYSQINLGYRRDELLAKDNRNYKSVSFDTSTNTRYISFNDHALAAKAEAAIAEVKKYALGLVLGSATIEEMDLLINRLTK